jgi:hypothetical protein
MDFGGGRGGRRVGSVLGRSRSGLLLRCGGGYRSRGVRRRGGESLVPGREIFVPGDAGGFDCLPFRAHSLGDVGSGIIHQTEGFFDFTASFRGDAAFGRRIELLLNIGAFGPGPKLVVGFAGGNLLLVGEPIPLEAEIFGIEFGAAEAGDVGRKLMEELPFDGGIGFGGERSCEGCVLEGGPAGELFGERADEGFITESLLVLEAAGDFEGILADKPIAEAGVSPIG